MHSYDDGSYFKHFYPNEETNPKGVSIAGIQFFLSLTEQKYPNEKIIKLIIKCTDKEADLIANVITSGRLPANFDLVFNSETMTSVGIIKIINAFASINAPKNVKLFFNKNRDKTIFIALATLLSSGKAPENLMLNFVSCEIGNENVTILAEGVKSKHNLKRLYLCLDGCNIQEAGVRAISEAIAYCPAGSKISLKNNGLYSDSAKHLAIILSQGKLPVDFTLDLSSNEIRFLGATYFAEALESKEIPNNLELNLSANEMTNAGIEKIAEVIKKNNTPNGLTLGLFMNGDFMEETPNKTLAEAMLYNTTIRINHIHLDDDLGKILRLCSVRNTLLLAHPELAGFIKEVSQKAGFYKSRFSSLDSLKWLTAKFILYHNEKSSDQEKLDLTRLPVEVRNYVEQLKSIKQELTCPLMSLNKT